MEAQNENRRLIIEQDDCPENPRDWDNQGRMFCWHQRYQLGDEQPAADPHEWLANFTEHYPDAVILPLYLMDHSGLMLSVGPFSCPWDSGVVGWIVCSRAYWEGLDREQVKANLQAEVRVYSQYLEGDVWGFTCQKKREACDKCGRGPDWETVDSCWGFFGTDWDNNGIKDNLPEEFHELLTRLP